VSAERELEDALAREDYAQAAVLRDRIRDLTPPPMPTSSDTMTRGLRVQIESLFDAFNSRPALSQFLFPYRVRISNESDTVYKLVSRFWIITDGRGSRHEVRGPGVIGATPILKPGEQFEYTSFCPLPTKTGQMEGSFHMVVLEEGDEGKVRVLDEFDAVIEPFALDTERSTKAQSPI
jgi:ApaG protein